MSVSYNSPVVLSFTFFCTLIMILSKTLGVSFMNLFVVFPHMSPTNVVDYFRLVSHCMGHADWNHLVGNFSVILLIGPLLEEKYGSESLIIMMFITAFITGVINVLFFTTGLLGASGIVFMMILLSSFTNIRQGKIPLTFFLIVALYMGREIVNMFENNNVSESAHLIGGLCGSLFGFWGRKLISVPS